MVPSSNSRIQTSQGLRKFNFKAHQSSTHFGENILTQPISTIFHTEAEVCNCNVKNLGASPTAYLNVGLLERRESILLKYHFFGWSDSTNVISGKIYGLVWHITYLVGDGDDMGWLWLTTRVVKRAHIWAKAIHSEPWMSVSRLQHHISWLEPSLSLSLISLSPSPSLPHDIYQ